MRINDANEQKAAKALPALNHCGRQATTLTEELLAGDIRCDIDNDHFGFMALCFLSEQVSYLRAITELVQQGQGKPAGLVARSMVEGMALLRWARADPSRPLHWRLYALIVDFRTMKQAAVAGNAIDPQLKVSIENELTAHGDLFLTKAAQRDRDAGKRLPEDPYVRSWYAPASLATIFQQIQGARPLYEYIYRPESERTHWSVGSLGRNIRRTEKGVSYAGDSSLGEAATALAVGFQALIETLQDVDAHLKLGCGDGIRGLRDEYVANLGELLG